MDISSRHCSAQKNPARTIILFSLRSDPGGGDWNGDSASQGAGSMFGSDNELGMSVGAVDKGEIALSVPNTKIQYKTCIPLYLVTILSHIAVAWGRICPEE